MKLIDQEYYRTLNGKCARYHADSGEAEIIGENPHELSRQYEEDKDGFALVAKWEGPVPEEIKLPPFWEAPM